MILIQADDCDAFKSNVDDEPTAQTIFMANLSSAFMTWHKMILIQADDCDAFNSNVDDEPTAQTIFMAKLSSTVSSLQQAGPSNASILSE
nr:hypothetical protein [Tanacetum cinerariifolium]